MKHLIRPRPLTPHGITHYLAPLLVFILLFGVAGTYFFITSHAATATYQVSNGNNYCIQDPGTIGATMVTKPCTQSTNQLFTLTGTGDTTHWHTYKNSADSFCIGTAGNKTSAGTKLQTVACANALTLYVSTNKQLEVKQSGGAACVTSASGTMLLATCANAGKWVPSAESGGSSGGGTSAQCASGGSYLWSNLAKCGWPDASNTGPVLSQCSGGKLTANSGSVTRVIKVTAANTTINCEAIMGRLDIAAKNVTIKNSTIIGSSGKTGTAANATADIFIEDGASATIDNVTINGDEGVHACIWHQGSSMSVDAVNCSGSDDGIFNWASSSTAGDNFTIKDSYFHDFTTKTSNGHEDGYQTEGASGGTISHNTYQMTSGADSAIAIWNSLKSSSNITVSNNLITGGGFAIYAEDYNPSQASPTGGFTTTKITFDNNDFSTHASSCVGQFGVWFTVSNAYKGGATDGWHRSGNKVLETGENIDNANPHNGNTLCN